MSFLTMNCTRGGEPAGWNFREFGPGSDLRCAEIGHTERGSVISGDGRTRMGTLRKAIMLSLPRRIPMDLTLDHRVSVSRDAIFRDINGEAVVLDLEAGIYYGLDEVGTCAWRALEDGGPLRRAFDVVLAEFDVDAATAERDLLQLAQALIDKRLWTLG